MGSVPTEEVAGEGMSVRVLVAADEDKLRDTILGVLEKKGLEAAAATNAEQALQLFRKKSFSLVITDLQMGDTSGLDLLREVKSREPDSMVVVMTDDPSPETAATVLRGGAYDCLVRSSKADPMISAVIDRAIDRHQLDLHNRALLAEVRRNAEELEGLNTRLNDMANRDSLTGLYNHRFFRDALEQELSRARRHARRFSIVFIDIDHFTEYNNSQGHLAGDALLCTLAKLFQERARGETLAARYGGQKFVLLAPEADPEGARRYAEIVRRMVEEHPFAGRETQPLRKVTLSLGVASYPEAGEDPTTLIEHAEQALRRAKSRGRNTVWIWDPSVA